MTACTYSLGGHALSFDDDTTHVMGVVNLSPESKNRDTFSADPAAARAMAHRYRDAGATLIDLGAQSSHYSNPEIPASEEIHRLLPTLEVLVGDGFVVSVDTWKPVVAAAAIAAGAGLINDTGGSSPEMISSVAGHDVGLVTMYLEGDTPLTVGDFSVGDGKTDEVVEQLRSQLDRLAAAGVAQVITDPGIGISYTSDYEAYTAQQVRVLRALPVLRSLGRPVLVPVPRKAEPARVAALMALSLEHGADIIRVHDVAVACDLVALFGREAP